jgi:formamidopyrimidine-DNA glycosylase
MPELPEVETVVRGLRSPLMGRTITNMTITWARTIHTPTPDIFASQIEGQTVMDVSRRAKFIVISLTHDTLLVHLKMTGRLYVTPTSAQNEADKWIRASFDLDNDHQLRFSDSRKFGKLYLTDNPQALLAHIGPEPLTDEFTIPDFATRIGTHHKAIKALLLDQTFIAGVGNIYADEALFRAKIHPQTPANTLSDDQQAQLFLSIRAVLNAGIDHEGASINWYRKPDGTKGTSQDHFFVYGRENLPCIVCGNPIHKIRVAQRGTHFCLHCQPFITEEL